MNVNKWQAFSGIVALLAAVGLTYNNCTPVSVAEAPAAVQSLAESSVAGNNPAQPSDVDPVPAIPDPAAVLDPEHSHPETDVVIPTPEEQLDVVNNLPPDLQTAEPIPVTELIENPDLFEVFKCSSKDDSVMICHYPQGTSPPNTQCIGRPAVSTHFGHSRTVTLTDGSTKTLVDYLGPCRSL